MGSLWGFRTICGALGQFLEQFCGALGQLFALQGETPGLGKVQGLVGLLSLKKGGEQRKGEQRIGDVVTTRHLC